MSEKNAKQNGVIEEPGSKSIAFLSVVVTDRRKSYTVHRVGNVFLSTSLSRDIPEDEFTARVQLLEEKLEARRSPSAKAAGVLQKGGGQRAPRLEVAPGFALHHWLSSVCPRSFKENVLDELLSTGTLMYQEALARGDEIAARNVRWAMRLWMLKAVLGGFVTGAFLLLAQFRRKSE